MCFRVYANVRLVKLFEISHQNKLNYSYPLINLVKRMWYFGSSTRRERNVVYWHELPGLELVYMMMEDSGT